MNPETFKNNFILYSYFKKYTDVNNDEKVITNIFLF